MLVGTSALAFAGGAVMGCVTTFTHRQLPPWGLVGGALIVAALVVGVRLATGGRLPAIAAALGAALAIAVLALPTSGGSVLVVPDLLGWAWGTAPVLAAAVAVAWPGSRARPESRGPAE